MRIKQKSPVTSIRLSHLERSKIKRIFNMNISEFLRACLKLSEENKYIKNKIKLESDK
jgi:hypothetical protein